MPVFSWLRQFRADELVGRLEAIFVAERAGAGMQSLQQVEAIVGKGLAGDRYANGSGHWRATDGCELTLVTSEDLAAAERRGGMSFAAGEHRRNLVVSGVPLAAFRRSTVEIGLARLAFHRLRPPCGYLDRLYRPGAGKALGRGAGIGLRVIAGGELRVGDEVLLRVRQREGG